MSQAQRKPNFLASEILVEPSSNVTTPPSGFSSPDHNINLKPIVPNFQAKIHHPATYNPAPGNYGRGNTSFESPLNGKRIAGKKTTPQSLLLTSEMLSVKQEKRRTSHKGNLQNLVIHKVQGDPIRGYDYGASRYLRDGSKKVNSYEAFLEGNCSFKEDRSSSGRKNPRKGPIRAQVAGFQEIKGDFESSLLKEEDIDRSFLLSQTGQEMEHTVLLPSDQLLQKHVGEKVDFIQSPTRNKQERRSSRDNQQLASIKRKKKRKWGPATGSIAAIASNYLSQKSIKKAVSRANMGKKIVRERSGCQTPMNVVESQLFKSPSRGNPGGVVSIYKQRNFTRSTKNLHMNLLKQIQSPGLRSVEDRDSNLLQVQKSPMNQTSSYQIHTLKTEDGRQSLDTTKSTARVKKQEKKDSHLPMIRKSIHHPQELTREISLNKDKIQSLKKSPSDKAILSVVPTSPTKFKSRGKTPVNKVNRTSFANEVKKQISVYKKVNYSVDRGLIKKPLPAQAEVLSDISSPRYQASVPKAFAGNNSKNTETKAVISSLSNMTPSHLVRAPLGGISDVKRLAPSQSTLSARPTFNNCNLSDSEKALYGDRCPSGYKKLDMLGKGGCAIVWLGQDKEEGAERVAMKQFPRGTGKGSTTMLMACKTDLSSYRTEYAIAQHLFTSGKFDDHKGLAHIAGFIKQVQQPRDYWMIHEVGGRPLSKMLFELKGQFYNSERIYHVHQQPFFLEIKNNIQILKDLLKRLFQFLSLLSDAGIVHSDLKSENILIKFDFQKSAIQNVKVIDFGSGFMSSQLMNISQTTPEYMAPEALKMMELKKGRGTETEMIDLENSVRPWSLDMWSVGAIFLEILTGFPMWLGLKGRTVSGRRSIQSTGVFSAPGRDPSKIMLKQRNFVLNLQKMLKKYDCFSLDRNLEAMDLLQRMLELNPLRRISPEDALRHPFIVQ